MTLATTGKKTLAIDIVSRSHAAAFARESKSSYAIEAQCVVMSSGL